MDSWDEIIVKFYKCSIKKPRLKSKNVKTKRKFRGRFCLLNSDLHYKKKRMNLIKSLIDTIAMLENVENYPEIKDTLNILIKQIIKNYGNV